MRVLATDLDGTFLAGNDATRAALTQRFRDDADRWLLYVSGRSSRSVTELVSAGLLPRPDAMICDVGSYVADASGAPLDGALLTAIAEAWGERSEQVKAAFAGVRGLRPQRYFGPYRVAYYYDTPEVLPEAHALADSLGCDGLVSDGQYFDVLPRGVNKGTTLRGFVETLGVASDEILVAGDTLNDLAMLTAGFPAVVVGNAEPALLAALPSDPRIYRATRPGCDGIAEALAHHGVEVSRG
ncbi:MAG: HAD family hydrolase [Gemmatimonadaceae bacterium]